MRQAYQHKQELQFEVVLEVVSIIRRVVPPAVFILSAAPGTFDEPILRFDRGHAQQLSEAGADGLFIEKDDHAEVERLTDLAHEAGLLVQASFQLRKPEGKTAVIPIDRPEESARAAR